MHTFPPTRSIVTRTAAVIALCIMGDSLIYSLLPLEAEALGIPLALVGVLLSANRMVRFGSNTLVGIAFERWGARKPFLISAITSGLTTLGYGLGGGFGVYLMARAGWGATWSALRQGGYAAVWAQPEAQRGRSMGLLWGIVGAGSAISVVLGGQLYDRYGYAQAFWVVAALGILAIPIAASIKWPVVDPPAQPTPGLRGWAHIKELFPPGPNRVVLGMGFAATLFDSSLTATASLYLATQLGDRIAGLPFGIGTLAGALLTLKFSANIFFSPFFGWLSDRIGRAATSVGLAIVIISSLFGAKAAPGLWIVIPIALIFISSAGMFTVANTAANQAAQATARPNLFVGIFTTAVDLGFTVGPLAAYSVGQQVGLDAVYLTTALVVLGMCMRFYWGSRNNS